MLGMGSGQPNRVESLRIAMKKAGDEVKGAALASDAFFPFGKLQELVWIYVLVIFNCFLLSPFFQFYYDYGLLTFTNNYTQNYRKNMLSIFLVPES